MAKMLRNTANGRWWACRCRCCRTNDRRGEDSAARRAQRARERQQWNRETRTDRLEWTYPA